MSQHGVGFAQRFHNAGQIGSLHTKCSREQFTLLTPMRKELVQGRIEETDGDRQSIHRLENPLEIGPLNRQKLGQRATPPAFVPGDDHLAHGGNSVALEEHVLGAAQPDSFGAEPARDSRVGRRVGVCPDLETARLVGPTEQPRERLVGRRGSSASTSANDRHDLARRRREIAAVDLSGGSVQCEPVAFGNRFAADIEAPVFRVDRDRLAADDRAFAHTARDDRRVARHASARRQHGASRDDSVKILRRRFVANENDSLASRGPLLGNVGVEHRDAAGGTWTRREPGAENGEREHRGRSRDGEVGRVDRARRV